MICLLLLLALIALLNAGLLLWVGVSINTNHKERLTLMKEQETRLNAALDVLSTAVATLVALVSTLVANNPDLSDETTKIEGLATSIQAAIEVAQGGGTPDPIPVPGEDTPGGTDGGSTDGGSTDGGSTDPGSSDPGSTEGGSSSEGSSSDSPS